MDRRLRSRRKGERGDVRTGTSAELRWDILEALGGHRYLTYEQIARLIVTSDPLTDHRGQTARLLRALRIEGLITSTRVEHQGSFVWYLTAKGLKRLKQERCGGSYIPSATQAGSMRYRHTWAVNEVGIRFVEEARRRGDEFGCQGWEPEILMRKATKANNEVIADAVLMYTLVEPGRAEFLTHLLELDRTTAPTRIVARLRAYCEIRADRSLWADRPLFRDGWPTILFVIAADPPEGKVLGEGNWAGDPESSAARCGRLLAYVAKEMQGDSGLAELPMLFAPLPALLERGPFAPVWRRPGHAEALDWLGRPAMVVHKGDSAAVWGRERSG
jgi:hypothetical protein